MKNIILAEKEKLVSFLSLLSSLKDNTGVVIYYGDNAFLSKNDSGFFLFKRQHMNDIPTFFDSEPQIDFNVFCRDPYNPQQPAIACPKTLTVLEWITLEELRIKSKISYLEEVLEYLGEQHVES